MTSTPDPAALDRVPALRKAHTVYERFRRSGRPVPFRIRLLDAQYHAQFRKPRPRPAGLLAQIRSDEQRRRWVQLELALGPLGVVRERDPQPEAEGDRQREDEVA